MGELKLSGLSTGIDTGKIVEQLMIINSRRLATYQVKQKDLQQKRAAFDQLRAKVAALRTANNTLSNMNALESFRVSSSNSDVLTASASSGAAEGSHSVIIKQLATAETWIQDTSGFDYTTDYVGGGSFIYSYNYRERVIQTIDGETTLQDLVNLINKDQQNPGVTASLLYTGGKYHLMLNGEDTGEDYQITVNTENTQVLAAGAKLTTNESGSEAGLTTKLINLYGFSGEISSGSTADQIHIIGNRHDAADPVDLYFDVTEFTTVDHLISKINEAFEDGEGNRTATATLVNGQIRLTDHTSGASELQLAIDFVPGTDSTAELELPAFAKILQGDTVYTLAAGGDAQLTSKFTELDETQFSGIPGASDKITISGTDTDGVAISEVELVVDGNTTFQDLIDSINTAFAGIATASFADGQIRLTDNASGASQTSITLTHSGDATMTMPTFAKITGGTDGGTVTADIDSLDPATFLETQSAQNSMIKIDGYPTGADEWIERNSNSITNALPGVSIQLQNVSDYDEQTSTYEATKVTVTRDIASVSSRVSALVTAYNDLMTYLEENTGFDTETKEMGILSSDVAVSFIRTRTRDPFIGIAAGFADQMDSFIQASSLGITFDAYGKMKFDKSELDDAIDEDFNAVLELLAASGAGNSDNDAIQFYNASSYTVPGEYDVRVETDAAGNITSALIKLASEDWSEARVLNRDGNILKAATSGDDPEKGLQLTYAWDGAEHTSANPVEATIRIKQGVAVALDNVLDNILDAQGQLDLSSGVLDSQIKQMGDSIEREQARLDREEERLYQKYARLETTLTLLQQQYASAGLLQMLQ
jgi:flagellar hook-associated protein 2